jgi:hypothetical protein
VGDEDQPSDQSLNIVSSFKTNKESKRLKENCSLDCSHDLLNEHLKEEEKTHFQII